MSGPATLACIDGTHWNGTAPHCQARQQLCDQPVDGVISKALANVMSIACYVVMVILLLLCIVDTELDNI